MSLSLYAVTIPSFIKNLKVLSHLLNKGLNHVSNDESKLINARLIDDMGDLIYQVQRLSDTAKGVAVRMGGAENVVLTDDEKDFPALQTRIEKTISILEALAPTSMDNKEESEIVIKTSSGERKFTGRDYILGFAIPNFYFHFVTAYAILRKEGVPVGKGDYLGTTLEAK
ncbi:Helix-turn-helix-domain containing type protein [Rutstroemia sp. NJR-2017a WRK4]|nr:Helix-turn-helix-domain containing type protein [Rutstroemia sp. NJR-2017a WRK4]